MLCGISPGHGHIPAADGCMGMLTACLMHTDNKEFSIVSGSLGLFYTEAQSEVELTFSQLN